MIIIESLVVSIKNSDRDILVSLDNEDKISLLYSITGYCGGTESSKSVTLEQLLNLIENTDLKQFDNLTEKVSKLEIENKALKSKLGRLNHIIERIKTFKLDYDE